MMNPYGIVLPERRADETPIEHVERIEWARQRYAKDHPNAPVLTGYVARSTGFAHWTDAAVLDEPDGARFNPKHAHQFDAEEVFGKQVPHPKQSGEQRVARLTAHLIADMEATYKAKGYLEFPRSVGVQLVEAYRQMGEIVTLEDLERTTFDGLRQVAEIQAKHLLVVAENQFGRDRAPEIRTATSQEASHLAG